jgi:hypothetical protein
MLDHLKAISLGREIDPDLTPADLGRGRRMFNRVLLNIQ